MLHIAAILAGCLVTKEGRKGQGSVNMNARGKNMQTTLKRRYKLTRTQYYEAQKKMSAQIGCNDYYLLEGDGNGQERKKIHDLF